jgi:hypothetical protein
MLRLRLVLLAFVLLSACAYPRRSTSLSPVTAPGASTLGAPEHTFSITIVAAQTGAMRRGSLSWDDGGGLPDCFVRIYRNDELVFESETINDSIRPEWNQTLPRNVEVPSGARIRLEVWDRDTLGADPVGVWRGVGMPSNAESGVDARVLLEGESWLTVRLASPRPHRGIGIRQFEIRGDALVITEIESHSPAGRAGLVVGDAIVAIGGRAVSSIPQNDSVTALSLAAERDEPLRVRGPNGSERVVQMDHGFTWLLM